MEFQNYTSVWQITIVLGLYLWAEINKALLEKEKRSVTTGVKERTTDLSLLAQLLIRSPSLL
jgi:hypothetical protein